MGEKPRSTSSRWLRRGVIAAAAVLLIGALVMSRESGFESPADPDNPQQVAHGKVIYAQYCMACHGADLEGQPNWRRRLASGRLPAPPHDASGHTWHHEDDMLFGMTKYGLVPGKYAPPGYESDMPAFAGLLSDEDIWAVLAYIKSHWPNEIRAAQREMTLRRRAR